MDQNNTTPGQSFDEKLSAKSAEKDVKSGAASRTLWSDAWKRLKRNKLAMAGLVWIIFMVLVALTADLWVPQTLGSPTAIDSATMTASMAMTNRVYGNARKMSARRMMIVSQMPP